MSRFFVSKYAQKKTRAREKSWQLYIWNDYHNARNAGSENDFNPLQPRPRTSDPWLSYTTGIPLESRERPPSTRQI